MKEKDISHIGSESVDSTEISSERKLPESINDPLGESLVKHGFVEAGKNREIIVDIERFRKPPIQPLYPALKEISDDYVYRGGDKKSQKYYNPIPALLSYFDGKEVITREDLEKGDKPKPLFYAPKTVEEAFDMQAIKESQFYLGFWDICGNSAGIPKSDDSLGKDISAFESMLACLIYHPSFGNGFQYKDHVFVYDSSGRTEKASTSYFKKMGWNSRWLDEFNSSPRRFLENSKIPTELIDPSWFQASSMGQEFFSKTIGKRGLVMLGGVRYFTSRKLAGHNVYRIPGDMAIITENDLEGREFPTHFFSLHGERSTKGGSFETLNAGKVNMLPFTMQEMHKRRKDETDEEHALRLKQFETFRYSLDLSKKLADEGVNLFSMGFAEAQVIATVAKEYGEEKIIDFISKFGKEGLSVLTIAQYDIGCAEAALNLVESKKAGNIFKEFMKIRELAIDFSELAEKGFEQVEAVAGEGIEDFHIQVREAIMRRAKDLILAGSLIKEGKSDMTLKDVEVGFEAIRVILEAIQSFTGEGRFDIRMEDHVTEEGRDAYKFSLDDKEGDKYDFRVLFRPKMREIKGRKEEARINFSLTPLTSDKLVYAFSQKITHASGDKRIARDIRMGIDLAQDLSGNIRGVSLDIGRSPSDYRDGDVLGKLFNLASEHGSHNPGSFDLSLKSPETFSKIVEAFRGYMDHFEIRSLGQKIKKMSA